METAQSVSLLQIALTAASSLIVALIGLYVGLRVDRSRQRKKQKKLYVYVLRSIYYDYKKNLDLQCQLHAYLFVKILPSFSLELSRKTALVQALVPVCLNFNLLDRISDGYFELVHVQRRLDQLQQSYHSAGFEFLRSGTYTLINNDIRLIFGILLEIIDEVRQRSDKSEGIDRLPEDYLTRKFEEFQNDQGVLSRAKGQKIDLSRRDRFDLVKSGLDAEASGSAPP